MSRPRGANLCSEHLKFGRPRVAASDGLWTTAVARMLSRPLLVPLLMHAGAQLPYTNFHGSVRLLAAPSKKIDGFQTVSVVCQKCSTTLFRYKKKNGLKSSLVKCYIERIVDDPLGLLAAERGSEMECPKCKSRFARDALIHGRPALKMVGGKVRMTK